MNTVTSDDGTSIAFEQSGEGPPVILVNGALGIRSDPMISQLAAALSTDFTVFSYDRRGRNDSGDTDPYTVEREVEDLAAIIGQAEGSAFVYGISSGAVLALDAAASGLDIEKLALYEPPFVVDESRPPVREDYVSRLEELLSSGQRGKAVELFMTEAVGVPDEFLDGMKQDPSWSWMKAVAHTLVYDGRIMGETMSGSPLPTERWNSISSPTLVLTGGNSPTFLHTARQALVDILPEVEHDILEEQDHDVDAEALAPVLQSYFSEDSS